MSGEKPKNYGQKLAESRSRILDLLLNTDDLADSILGEEPDVDDATRAQLMDYTAELSSRVQKLHAADVADVLEALPIRERLALWRLVEPAARGKALVEVSETVWDSLIEEMSDKDLLKTMSLLDVDDQVYLAEYLPRDLTGRVLTSLEPKSAGKSPRSDEVQQRMRWPNHGFRAADRPSGRHARRRSAFSALPQNHSAGQRQTLCH